MKRKYFTWIACLGMSLLVLQSCAGSKKGCGCENDINRKHSR